MRSRIGIGIATSLFIALASAACGGGPGTGPPSADELRAFCERSCEYQQSCGNVTDVAECTSNCVSESGGAQWIRADALDAFLECSVARPCDAVGDECLGACEPTSAHERFEDRCQVVMAPCFEPGELEAMCSVRHIPGESDSGLFCMIVPSIMDELTACLPDGTSCQVAFQCISAVLERHDIDL